jgi:hypothetical protein
MPLLSRTLSRVWTLPMRQEVRLLVVARARSIARVVMLSRYTVATRVRRSDLPRNVCAKNVAANVRDVGLRGVQKESHRNRTIMKILGSLMKSREPSVLVVSLPTWNHSVDDPIVPIRRRVDSPTSPTGVTDPTSPTNRRVVSPRRRVASRWTVTGVAVVEAVATRTDRVGLIFRKCRNRVVVLPMTCFVWKCSWPWWVRLAMPLLMLLGTGRVRS